MKLTVITLALVLSTFGSAAIAAGPHAELPRVLVAIDAVWD
jgi:hypothetical protein